MKKNLLSIFALVAVTLSFTACKKKDEVKGTSYIQITNASETTSPFDFYIDNNKVNTTPLQYGLSTEYISTPSGTHEASMKVNASGAVLEGFTITPQPGAYYSIFYFGENTVAYQDALVTPPSGKARVRFINLNEELIENLDFGITGGSKLVTNFASYFETDYYNVDPNTSFSVYLTGTNTSLKDVPTTIQAGHIYTIYFSGENKGSLKGNVLLQK